MFHYRLASPSNRSRMLIAVFLAIALHMGLMNFELTPKPVLVPSISLPRSVSIFLKQESLTKIPVDQFEKTKNIVQTPKEKPPTEKKLQEHTSQRIYPEKTKTIIPLQKPTLIDKTNGELIAKEIVSVPVESEDIAEDIHLKPVATLESQKSATPAESQTSTQNDGASLSGILQVAYPRYQLNSPPAYPGLARKRGQEGTVILQVLVSQKGRVDALKIENSSGYKLLDRAAVSAVQKWSFEPGKRGKDMVPMWVRVPVTFKLEN